MIRQWIRPELGARKVADIRHADIDALHRMYVNVLKNLLA